MPAAPGPQPGRPFPTSEPTLWVRSLLQQRVAQTLQEAGVSFDYEVDLLGFRPDFVVTEPRMVVHCSTRQSNRHAPQLAELEQRTMERQGYEVCVFSATDLTSVPSTLRAMLRRHGVEL